MLGGRRALGILKTLGHINLGITQCPDQWFIHRSKSALSEELHEVFSKIEYGELEVPRKFSFLEN